MLKKWGLSNFKSISNANLDIAPLTIFTGVNSSGKSSFIQSMLLAAQSLVHKSPDNTLIKNDEFVQLGEYSDIYNYSGKKSMPAHNDDADKTSKSSENIKIITVSYVIDEISGEFTFGDPKKDSSENLKPCVFSSKISTSYIDDNFVEIESSMDISECYDGVAKKFKFDEKSEHEFILKEKELNMNNPYIDMEQFLPSRIEFEMLKTKSDKFFVDLPFNLQQASYKIRKFFNSSFNYISSFREEPRTIYLYPPKITINPSGIGARGENTAAVLAENGQKIVSYIPPNAFSKQQTQSSFIKEAELSVALNEWICYLGLAESINSKREKFGYVLNVKMNGNHSTDEADSPVHVGAGVSNTLPVLVMCLNATPYSTLVFEEPELHLHPKVQSRLADFFLSVVLMGKQCIIETHSEYFIYNLRYRISEALLKNDETIQSSIKLYFADKKNGRSEFQEIKVNRHGELSAWPEGFFDERQKLSDKMLDGILAELEHEDV